MFFSEYLERVREMNPPIGEYAILGSGPIVIRGLREGRDLDLIVTQDLYEEYKKRGWNVREAYGREFLEKDGIEMWKDIGPGEWSIEELIANAELIEGFPFVNLRDFIRWKKVAGREKDLKDIELAEQHLRQQNN